MAIKIFIDQGHNPSGFNAGAEGFGLREQDINYNVGTYLADLLRQDDRFEVRTSRTSPDEILGFSNASSLAERVRMANEWPANYFISIHANASENPNINGTEMYIYRLNTQPNWLAEDMLEWIVNVVGTRDNGIRVNPSLYVLRSTKMPAVLVELAYISNYEDNLKLRDNQYEFAYALYRGILQYFGFEEL